MLSFGHAKLCGGIAEIGIAKRSFFFNPNK